LPPNGCLNLIRIRAAVALGPIRQTCVAAFPHGDSLIEGGSIVAIC